MLPLRKSLLPVWLDWPAVVLARLLYRVRSCGSEQIPGAGGALLVVNHLSYVDAFVLQLACPRPIRFLAYAALHRPAFFNWVLRRAGGILLEEARPEEAIAQAVKALQRGELVAMFPEGRISRTGQLMALEKDFVQIAQGASVPVIPVMIDGLWGSVFSFAGKKYLWKSPRLMPTPVFVAFGAPLPAGEVSSARARQSLLDLGAVAFAERPRLRRNLARECVCGLVKQPGRVVVIDRTAERRVVNAATLVAAAAALSRHLRRAVPEKRIGIVLPPGAGAFIANLAVACAGKTPVNLNFTTGKAALVASMKIGGIETIISAKAMQQKLPAFPWLEQTLDLRELIAAAGGKKAILPWLAAVWLLPNQWVAGLLGLPKTGDEAEAGLLFTSGSSGEPKGVVFSHRNLLANCEQISSMSILPADALLVGCLPIFHSFGFTVTMWYPMLRGCRVVTVPSPLDTRKIVDAIREDEATVLVGAPTFLRPMLRKAESGELRSLELVVSGAEKLPSDLYDQFLARFNIEIMQGYGLTETSPVTDVNQPHPPTVALGTDFQEGKRVGSTGRIMPGMSVRVLHPETKAILHEGETGIVCFKGANVFSGYLDDAEKTTAAFHDGWFVTGDLGRIDADGFLFIEGRLSRFSKIGGEMVPHGTVEQAIISAFGWEEMDSAVVAVAGVPDDAKGEALVLLTSMELSREDLREKLTASGLSSLWVPKIIVKVDKIPVLGTGKLDLKACRELALTSVKSNA